MTEIKEKEIEEFFSRAVDSFIDPSGSFKKKLVEKAKGNYDKDIIVKFGVDPTRPDIHIGHAVVLRKLRTLQDIGCKVIFLVGDFTARIGDPTGKSKIRPEIEQEEVEANMKTYLDQVGKILKTDPEVFSWIRNSDWFTSISDLGFPQGHTVKLSLVQDGKEVKVSYDANSFPGKAAVFEQTRMQRSIAPGKGISVITLRGFLWTLRRITHSRLIERDMFQNRINGGNELAMSEMMYPVLQGIDSHVLSQIYGSCDLEVGGNDQTFNMLMGRDVMKINNVEEQSVLAFDLLKGTDGKEKMSKSLDNYIGITEDPSQIYGKVMSIPDDVMVHYFEIATYASKTEIEEIKKVLEKGGSNPRDVKMRLAREIVSTYHGEQAAQEAEKEFFETFSKGGIPDSAKEIDVEKGVLLVEVLVKEGLVSSKTEFNRLLKEGAVSGNGEKYKDGVAVSLNEDVDIKVGKHRFIKIKVR